MNPLYELLDELTLPADTRLAVAIGVFDGVHRGHQALLRACREASETSKAVVPAALTFDPHPAAVFAPSRVPALLGTLDERAALLREYGAQRVIVARFDREFAALTPDAFVMQILVDRLQAQTVVVGDDFRYGCNRTGDLTTLRREGEHYSFAVRVVAPVFVDGTPARSTNVRHLLGGGQVEEAARLLGRPYALSGEVVRGRQLGRTLGYPTANLATAPGVLVPASGVYAGYAHRGRERFRAAISVGDNPTIAPGLPRTVEAFLLDGFASDLYGAHLTVDFVSRLRPMEKFDGLDTLIAQMARDVAEAERLLF